MSSTSDVVTTGRTVTVRNVATGAVRDYLFVDADPQPAAGRLNAASPVGRAVLGHHVGEHVVVEAPRGSRELEILAVL
jgi:transcription elongation factor GreA